MCGSQTRKSLEIAMKLFHNNAFSGAWKYINQTQTSTCILKIYGKTKSTPSTRNHTGQGMTVEQEGVKFV